MRDHSVASRIIFALVALAPLAACSRPEEGARDRTPLARDTGQARFAVEVVARGLVVPWGLAFAPDGRIFVTERGGRIRVIEHDTLRPKAWASHMDVAAEGEAGLMGIALAPDFATNPSVYVVATFKVGDALVNRVLRFRDQGGTASAPEVIVDGIPSAHFHAGDAIAFGPDGMLYVATGDARDPGRAQRPASLAGKILRYTPDGDIPPDNPTPGSPVYALGLRNTQGLAWDPATGQLFATDHGPSGFPNERLRRGHDELNAVRPGGNYGWPRSAGLTSHGGDLPPLVDWSEGIAPSGVAYYAGAEFPGWRGSLVVAALRERQLRRVTVARDPASPTGWRAVSEEILLGPRYGRLRAVAVGRDGHLYVTTSNRDGRGNPDSTDDRVLRIVRKPP